MLSENTRLKNISKGTVNNENNETQEKTVIKTVYEEIANEYDERIPGSTASDKLFTETEFNFLLNRINSSDNVLDMGCGTGRFTIPIAQKARKTTGLDISAAMLAKADEKSQKLSLNIDFQEGDMANMPFEDSSFDVITSMLALMHIPLENRQQVFVEASRVLKPGGRMIVSVKNSIFERLSSVDRFASVDITDIEDKQLIFTATKSGKELTAPWYSFSPQELNTLFSVAGLNVVQLKGNIPLSAWLSDKVLEDTSVRDVISKFEKILGDIPPFNYFGYHIIAEAVKPLR